MMGFEVLEQSDEDDDEKKSDVLSLGEEDNVTASDQNDLSREPSLPPQNNNLLKRKLPQESNDKPAEKRIKEEHESNCASADENDQILENNSISPKVKQEVIESTAPLYSVDLVYKVTRDNISHRLMLKIEEGKRKGQISQRCQRSIVSALKKILYPYSLKYIDLSYNDKFVHLRFDNAAQAQKALIEEPSGLSLVKVSGDEELNYWRHIMACWSDSRMMKSRHRNLSRRYKPISTKQKLIDKIDFHNEGLQKKHIQLY